MMRAYRHGFSLIQLLIVCSALAILMTLSVPQVLLIRRYMIRAELEKMYMLFFYVQHKAIACNQQQEIRFNTDTHSYCTGQRQEQLPSGVTFGFLPHSFGTPSHPKRPIEKPITFIDNKAIFYPDGTFSAGTLYLIDTHHDAMYALTSAVAPVRFIRKYRYAQGSWVPLT